jgi:hypothetical protein
MSTQPPICPICRDNRHCAIVFHGKSYISRARTPCGCRCHVVPKRERDNVFLWAIHHEGKLLGCYERDTGPDGALTVARLVPGCRVTRYRRDPA